MRKTMLNIIAINISLNVHQHIRIWNNDNINNKYFTSRWLKSALIFNMASNKRQQKHDKNKLDFLSKIKFALFERNAGILIYTEFILFRGLYRKLIAYIETLSNPIPRTNQYWAMIVKFLAQGNNDSPLTGFELTWTSILRLLVQHVNQSATPAL